MQTLETYKRAVVEYSRLRPRIEFEQWTPPTPGEKLQAMPADAIGVASLEYGVWAPLNEVMTATETNILWDDSSGQLALNPAPTEETTVAVVWKKVHPVTDEGVTTTIPIDHLPYVDDLEQALLLELAADELNEDPVEYTVGQTKVSRFGAAATNTTRAAQLRQKVIQALEDPLAMWA